MFGKSILKLLSKLFNPTRVFIALMIAVIIWLFPYLHYQPRTIVTPIAHGVVIVKEDPYSAKAYGPCSDVHCGAGYCCQVGACVPVTRCGGGGGDTPPPTPPSISGTLNCTQWGPTGWCISALNLDLSAIDPDGNAVMISGDVNGVAFACPNQNTSTLSCSIPLTSEGIGTANFTVIPMSGLTASGSTNYYLDVSTPQINGTLNCTNGLNNWCISNASVSASAGDSISGIVPFIISMDGGAWTTYTPLTLTDGIHTVTYSTTDYAGNSNQTTQTVQVDTITPNLNASVSGTLGTNGWYKSNVQVSATASDAGSGLSKLEVS